MRVFVCARTCAHMGAHEMLMLYAHIHLSYHTFLTSFPVK
jgi:hypothetical protein